MKIKLKLTFILLSLFAFTSCAAHLQTTLTNNSFNDNQTTATIVTTIKTTCYTEPVNTKSTTTKNYNQNEAKLLNDLVSNNIKYYDNEYNYFNYDTNEIVDNALKSINRYYWSLIQSRPNKTTDTAIYLYPYSNYGDDYNYSYEERNALDERTYAILYNKKNNSIIFFLVLYMTNGEIYFFPFYSAQYDSQVGFDNMYFGNNELLNQFKDKSYSELSQALYEDEIQQFDGYNIVEVGTIIVPKLYKPEYTSFKGKDEIIERVKKNCVTRLQEIYKDDTLECDSVDCYLIDFNFFDLATDLYVNFKKEQRIELFSVSFLTDDRPTINSSNNPIFKNDSVLWVWTTHNDAQYDFLLSEMSRINTYFFICPLN